MKKTVSTFIIIALVITIIMPQQAYAEVVKADTPTGAVGLKWKWKPATGSPTPPLISGDYIYVCAGSTLYKMNKSTGEVITSVALAGNVGYSMLPPVEGDNKIYISMGSGVVQALDKNTLSSVWVSSSDGLSGQTISPIIYHNNQIFTGTYSSSGGHFYCIDTSGASAGRVKWKVANPKGYYWSGAYATDNGVVFGSDADSSGKAVITSVNPQNGNVLSTMSVTGNVRSTIVENSGNLYVATQGNKLYSIPFNANDGTLNKTDAVEVDTPGETTGKPTILDGKLYLGTKNSAITVYDLTNLSSSSARYSISTPGYAQNGVLIARHSNGQNYLYTTYNAEPGGIAMGTLNGNSTTLNGNYFVPADSQFCLSPIVADASTGVIYYKNDSFNLMAVDKAQNAYTPKPTVSSKSYSSIKIKWEKAANAIGYDIFRSTKLNGTYKKIKSVGAKETSYINKKLKTGKKYFYKIRAKYSDSSGSSINGLYSKVASAKPTLKAPKIKTKSKKKSVQITWKKVNGATGYVVYKSTKKNGKYKKVKVITKGKTKSWTNKKLTSKKKYYYKVKAYRKVSGKKVYSVYSNISYKKSK